MVLNILDICDAADRRLNSGPPGLYSDYTEINGHPRGWRQSGARLCGSQLGAVWRWGVRTLFEVIWLGFVPTGSRLVWISLWRDFFFPSSFSPFYLPWAKKSILTNPSELAAVEAASLWETEPRRGLDVLLQGDGHEKNGKASWGSSIILLFWGEANISEYI